MLLCGIWEAKPSEAKTKIVVFMGGEKDGKILFTWYSDKHRKDECVLESHWTAWQPRRITVMGYKLENC